MAIDLSYLQNVRNRFARGFTQPRQFTYNPFAEELFSQAAAAKPTTSILGAVAKGILSAYLGQKLGEARKAYTEGETEKAMKRQFGLLTGVAQAREAARATGQLVNPKRFKLTPKQEANVTTILGLMQTNPEFQRGLMTDPTFFAKAVRTPLTSPETGQLDVTPIIPGRGFVKKIQRPTGDIEEVLFGPGGEEIRALGKAAPTGGGAALTPTKIRGEVLAKFRKKEKLTAEENAILQSIIKDPDWAAAQQYVIRNAWMYSGRMEDQTDEKGNVRPGMISAMQEFYEHLKAAKMNQPGSGISEPYDPLGQPGGVGGGAEGDSALEAIEEYLSGGGLE